MLLYRPETDLLCCLSKTLKLMHNANLSFLSTSESPTEPQLVASTPSVDDELAQFNAVCSKLNKRLRQQIKQILDQDAATPYDISKFDVNYTIANIDPFLWRMVVHITRTVTETRHDTAPDNISHQRKLNCLYCLCVMFFANNRCCSIPLHLLLTDLIESQGGSCDLIRILNRFGAVASSDTHRRYVQFKVQQKMSLGFLNELNLDNFTAASVDNIDFLQRHSFVYCGDQSRSWHGTTIQVVQPLAGCAQATTNESMDTEQVSDSSQSTTLSGSNQVQSSDKRERPATQQSPTLTTKSPAYKKITRRSRSLSECKNVQPIVSQTRRALFPASSTSSFAQLSYNHYTPLKSNHSINEFHLTEPEKKEFKKFKEMAFLYIVHR